MTARSRDVRTKLQVSSVAFIFVISLLISQSEARSVNPDCPAVMCAVPCPQGQYLALNDEGCETCDCYDPCESFECDSGECHWRLDRETDRPAPFCVECDGGRQWTECGGGEKCVATCTNTIPRCPRDCYEGCFCPPDQPVWHHGRCITADQCRGDCDGDQQWTDCGSETTLTCEDPDPDSTEDACVPRCQCPRDRPVWDDDRQICINADECVVYWKRMINRVE